MRWLHVGSDSHVKQQANNCFCRNVLYALKLFLSACDFNYQLLSILFVSSITSDDEDAAATRLVHEKRGSTFATNCFVVRDIGPCRDVAEYSWLYPITLDARCFGAKFGDGRNYTMFDLLRIRRDTYVGAWNRRWANAGHWWASIKDAVGRFDMPIVWHADKVSYVSALRRMQCGTEGDWGFLK